MYQISLRAIDLAGNFIDSTVSLTITNVAEFGTINIPTLSTNPVKGVTVTITVGVSDAGKVQFYSNGKRIPNCLSVSTSGSSPNIVATCNWKPTVAARVSVSAKITPTDVYTSGKTSDLLMVHVVKRVSNR